MDRGHIIRLHHRLVRSHRELSGLVRLNDRADKEICVECERPMSGQQAPSGTLAFDWIDFGALVQYLQNLDGHVVALHDRARLLQEEVSDQLTVQTNRQLYVLSILTAVLVPPTIVVGIFGMNTGGLPLTVQPTGFGIALALCAVSSLVVLGVMFASGVISRPSLRLRLMMPSSRPRANRHAGARYEAETAGMLNGLGDRSAEERTIE